jgi:hypothetical protein
MATIEENIVQMAQMVANVKRTTHLQEQTIMRIVDMTFALAERNQPPMPEADFVFPEEPEETPTPEETEEFTV